MPCKWNKPRQIHLAFLPNAPGERDAMLVLHFFDGRRLQKFKVKRKLRGVAISPWEKQRPQPSRPEKSNDQIKIVFSKQVDLVHGSTTEPRIVVSEENGLTLKSTANQDRTFPIATAPIVINKLARDDSLVLVDVELTGAESTWYVVNTPDEIG